MIIAAAATQTVQQSTASLIIIAMIAMVGAVLAASIPIVVNGRQNRKQREQDWARQDAVAARAEEAVIAAEKVAETVAETAKEARESAHIADAKLTKIAHQTDGLYTSALESELRALQGQAATLREVIALRMAADPGIDNARALAVVEAAEQRIVELEEGLKRRAAYQEEVGKVAAGPVEVRVVNDDPVDVAVVPPKD